MVTAYTPHEDGEVQYVSEPYHAPGTEKKVVRFWGTGQTSAENEAIPVAHSSTAQIAGTNWAYRYQFKGANPDEIVLGEAPVDLEFLAAADVPTGYIQLITRGTEDEAALLDYQILKLPVGVWLLNFFASHKETADTTVGSWLYESANAADDAVVAHRAVGYASVLIDPLETIADANRLGMNVSMDGVIITNTVTKYLTFITTGFGDNGPGIFLA